MCEAENKSWWDTDRDVKRVSVAMLCALLFGAVVTVWSIDIPVRPPRAEAAPAGADRQAPPGPGTTPPAAASAPASTSAPAAPSPARTDLTDAEKNAMRWAALLWAGACLAVGSFIGFIFGIPRSLSSDTARTGAPAQPPEIEPDKGKSLLGETPAKNQSVADGRGPSTAVNTNLEQISDWLTKIIVGVSLVNSEKIGQVMLRAAGTMADSIGGGAERQSLALAIMVYFSVVGLLGGYLLTRLFLQRAFDTAGNAESDR